MDEKKNFIPVGEYTPAFNHITGQNLPCDTIYQSPGLIAHLRKRHPGKEGLISVIPAVIAAPDFIGKHPKESGSIELVQVADENVMVCVKLDQKDGYFYVASVYEISNSKLANRIASGRLKKYAK